MRFLLVHVAVHVAAAACAGHGHRPQAPNEMPNKRRKRPPEPETTRPGVLAALERQRAAALTHSTKHLQEAKASHQSDVQERAAEVERLRAELAEAQAALSQSDSDCAAAKASLAETTELALAVQSEQQAAAKRFDEEVSEARAACDVAAETLAQQVKTGQQLSARLREM